MHEYMYMVHQRTGAMHINKYMFAQLTIAMLNG